MSKIPYDVSKNEPVVRPLIKKSFAFVPSAGMRLSPEILVFELFREIFFKHHSESAATIELDPDKCEEDRTMVYSIEEQAVLHSLRGRRKKRRNSKVQRFFAPAYPSLTRAAWFGKKRERVIYNFLLHGPIAQHLWHRGPDVEDKQKESKEIIKLICTALNGHNSSTRGNYQGRDILSVALRNTNHKIETTVAQKNLEKKTEYSNSIIRIDHDELSSRIFKDLQFICQLERDLPRIQWIYVLMTFLRIALPMWMLAQMRITSLLHHWLVNAIDHGCVENAKDIANAISLRNRGIFNLTITPTRELIDRVEQFMKHRIELNIILHWLEFIQGNAIKGKVLDLIEDSSRKLSVEKLLIIAKNTSVKFQTTTRYKEVAPGLSVRHFLTREGEQFPGWRNPLKRGQGKNIDEFLRVMYKDEVGDEVGGYLLIPEGIGQYRGFRVFPGQLLLNVITHLAAQDKHTDRLRGGSGKLVLGDIENHFYQYGINFSKAADARPLLIREMQALGLLTGSPDAGSSVSVSCPY